MSVVDPRPRPILFRLAAEGIVPVVGGCAGALAGGVEGGLAGVAVANVVEKAINLFGRGIVERWQAWFAQHTPEQQAEALSELVTLTPTEAREQARELLLELAPNASAADLDLALDYLSAIPSAVDRVLVTDVHSGKKTLPPTVAFDDPESLIRLLPVDLPPYHVPTDLVGTPYRLEELLGAGGFGAVYRASAKTLQHLPFAIKFCLDRGLLASLQKERANLERLMKAAGDRGAEHVVRLYGYDLDHATPYLVYEFVPGGDLTRHLAELRHRRGRPLNADEVLALIRQTAEGLAFAHRHGLVHRDVKPANVLVAGGRRQEAGDRGQTGTASSELSPAPCLLSPVLKLADFGLGGVAVTRAVQRSRIGLSTIDYLSLAEQASLFRGAGTPLYMSPEQRRGANPDPRHDLYSLGVMWYQLLIGDVTRELHPGWAKELKVRHAVPPAQIELIERCVGWYDERPADANELLALIAGTPPSPSTGDGRGRGDELSDPGSLPVPAEREQSETLPSASGVTPSPPPDDELSRELLRSQLKAVADAHERIRDEKVHGRRRRIYAISAAGIWLVVTLVAAVTADGSLAVSVAFVAALLLGFAYAVAQAQYEYDLNAELRRATKELTREFPELVEAWGGAKRFANAAFVEATLVQVARPDFRVSAFAPPSAPPEPAPTVPATRMRWRWAVGFALPIAVAAGIFAAVRYEEHKGPFSITVSRAEQAPGRSRFWTETQYVHADGTKTDAAGYRAAYSFTETIARVGGLTVGVAVFAGAIFGFRRPMRFPRVTVASAMVGFVFPGIMLGAAAYANYCEQFEPKEAVAGFITKDYQGREVKNGGYIHLARRDLALQGFALAAIPACLSALGVMFLGRWVMSRRMSETAPRFEFEAVTPDGRVVRDTVAAPNADDALQQVRDRGLFITTLTERGPGPDSERVPLPAQPPPDGGNEPEPAPPAQEVAPPSSTSGLRRSLLRAKAKELADAYESLHRANRLPVFPWVWSGFFLGALVGWLAGEALYLDFHGHNLGVTFPAAFKPNALHWEDFALGGLAIGLGVWFVTVLLGGVWRGISRQYAKLRVATAAADLARKFPGPVAAWGGRSVLETEDTALAVCRAVARGDDPVVRARTLDQAHTDPDTRARLERLLSDYSREHEKAERLKDYTRKLLVGSWFFSPVLGLLAGGLVSFGFFMALDMSLVGPDSLVFVAGVTSGLGVTALSIWLFKRFHDLVQTDANRRLAALKTDLEHEFAPALRSLGVDFENAATVTAPLAHPEPAAPPSTDPMRQEVLIGRLKEHYKLLEARDEPPEIAPTLFAWVGPFLGLIVGVILFSAGVDANDNASRMLLILAALGGGGGLAVGSVWLGQWLARTARQEREARLRESRESLARDYAPQLAEWGGVGLLSYKEAVAGAVRKLGGDPDW